MKGKLAGTVTLGAAVLAAGVLAAFGLAADGGGPPNQGDPDKMTAVFSGYVCSGTIIWRDVGPRRRAGEDRDHHGDAPDRRGSRQVGFEGGTGVRCLLGQLPVGDGHDQPGRLELRMVGLPAWRYDHD